MGTFCKIIIGMEGNVLDLGIYGWYSLIFQIFFLPFQFILCSKMKKSGSRRRPHHFAHLLSRGLSPSI